MRKLRLNELLKEKGINAKRLSEIVEISENTIGSIKNHKSSPTFETLVRIAEALKVDVCELIEPVPNEKIHLIINDKLQVFHSLEALRVYIDELENA